MVDRLGAMRAEIVDGVAFRFERRLEGVLQGRPTWSEASGRLGMGFDDPRLRSGGIKGRPRGSAARAEASTVVTARGDDGVRALLARLAADKSLGDHTAQLVQRALSEPPWGENGRSVAWRAAHALALQGKAEASANLAVALGPPWPGKPRLLLALAPVLTASGYRDEAAALARGALECLPADEAPEVSALAYRAYRCMASAVGMNEAIRVAAAHAAPTGAPVAKRFAYATLLGHARRHTEAREELAACRRLSPGRKDYAVAFGQAMLRTAPPQDAAAAIEAALRQWPDDPSLLYQWSNSLKACGRVPEATAAALAVLRTDEAPRGAHAHAIGLLLRAGKDDEAVGVVEHALAAEPPELNLGPVGVLLSRCADRSRAARLARRLLQLTPSSAETIGLVSIGGAPAVLSHESVRRRHIARGAAPPAHIFAAFAGKGHKLHNGIASSRVAADVEMLEMDDVTLHVFPYGFAVTDRHGQPYDFAGPVLHADLIDYAHRLPFIAEMDELCFASDGKYAANNYCHWLLDYLPRILWGSILFEARPIAVPAITLDSFRKSSLDHIGFDRRRLLPLQHGRYAVRKFATLSNCEPRYFRNALHGGNRDYAAPLLDAFPVPATAGARRLFLTRAPGSGRSFTNYQAVIDVVRSYGFDIIDPGHHGFAEQVRMLGEAGFVAGPHGAALTNLLFCAPGARVLEIFPQDTGTLPFAMLSAVRDLRYDACIGDVPPLSSIAGIDGNRADFAIAPDRLDAALSRLTDDADRAASA